MSFDTRKLYAGNTPWKNGPAPQSDGYDKPPAQMTDRSLASRLCRPGGSTKGPVMCNERCPSYGACQYGQEYLRRKAVKA